MIDRLRAMIVQPLSRLPLPETRLLPIIVVAYACLLPREFSLEVSGAALFPYRLALLAMAPLCVASILHRRIRPSLVDVFALFTALWFFIALLNVEGLQLALTRGVALTLDFGLAYFVGRTAIRTSEDVRTVFAWLLPGLLLVAAVMLVESVLQTTLLRPAVASITDAATSFEEPEIRLGLARALGPFPHPILAGVFMASTLPLAFLATRDFRLRILACLAALSGFFSLSAAALISLLLGGLLLAIYAVQRRLKLPLFALAGIYALLLVVFIEIGSQNGAASFLLRYLTINPASGSYRLLIWEFGWADAMRHPWFGIGNGDWVRPSWMPNPSVDSLWLVLPLYYGVPALIGTVLTLAGSFLSLIRTQRLRRNSAHRVGAALAMMLGILGFAGITVHLWESLLAWVLLVCGMGVGLASEIRGAAAGKATGMRSIRKVERGNFVAPHRRAKQA